MRIAECGVVERLRRNLFDGELYVEITKNVAKRLINCVLGSVDGASLHHFSALPIPHSALGTEYK